MNSDMSNRGRSQQQQQGTATANSRQQPQESDTAMNDAAAEAAAAADLEDETEENGNSSNEEEGGNNSDNSALVSIGNTSFGFNFDSDERMSRNENTSDNDGDISGDGGSGSGGGCSSGGGASPNESSSSQQQQQSSVGAAPQSAADQDRAFASPLTDAEEKVRAMGAATEALVSNTSDQATADASLSSSNDAVRRGSVSDSNKPDVATAPAKACSTSTGITTATNVAAAATVPSSKTDLDQAAAAAAKAAAHTEASNRAIANLKSLVDSCVARDRLASNSDPNQASRKRKGDANGNNDSGGDNGYNSDDEGNRSSSQNSSGGGKGGKRKKQGGAVVDVKKREERNAREKERSFRISKQIDDLRNALSSGGVIVPKGTKSSVLTEAANYIRMLQQHQYRSEIDRHQLIQQMQMIGAGAHGPQAAQTIRQVAAQQGVWSLGNFGGVPPKSAIVPLCPQSSGEQTMQGPDSHTSSSVSSSYGAGAGEADAMHPTKIDSGEYRSVFNSCGVGMAIASMGGAFIDCNQLFCHISNYTKQEVCSLTVFNLTERQDLQHAFDLICKIISPPMTAAMIASADGVGDGSNVDADIDSDSAIKNIVLRGAMKDRSGIGLCISLVKQDGVAKCFCVTLIKNPSSPFDTSKPVPLSFEMAAAMMSATPSAATAATTLISKDQPDNDNNPGSTRHTFTSG